MSKRYRGRLDKAVTSREYNIILLDLLYPIYWDEGVHFYPEWKRGFKNPNKRLMSYQVRKYRTWKHNRKTQYKNKK